jgi:hypothetical protein
VLENADCVLTVPVGGVVPAVPPHASAAQA